MKALKKKVIALLLIISILFPDIVKSSVLIAQSIPESDPQMSSEFEDGQIILSNEFLKLSLQNTSNEDNIGIILETSGGNPNITSDDNRYLLNIYNSNSHFEIGDSDTEQEVFRDYKVSEDGKALISQFTKDDIQVIRSVSLAQNPITNHEDLFQIKYEIINKSTEKKNVSLNYSTFFLEEVDRGELIKIEENEGFSSETVFEDQIPSFWREFDHFAFPTSVKFGMFYQQGDIKPKSVYMLPSNGNEGFHQDKLTRTVPYSVNYGVLEIDAGESMSASYYYGIDSSFNPLDFAQGVELFEQLEKYAGSFQYDIFLKDSNIPLVQGDELSVKAEPVNENWLKLNKEHPLYQNFIEGFKLECELIDSDSQKIELVDSLPLQNEDFLFEKKISLKVKNQNPNLEEIEPGEYTLRAKLVYENNGQKLEIQSKDIPIQIRPKDIISKIRENLDKIQYEIRPENTSYAEASPMKIVVSSLEREVENNELRKIVNLPEYSYTHVQYEIYYHLVKKDNSYEKIQGSLYAQNNDFDFNSDLYLYRRIGSSSYPLKMGDYKLHLSFRVKYNNRFVEISKYDGEIKITPKPLLKRIWEDSYDIRYTLGLDQGLIGKGGSLNIIAWSQRSSNLLKKIIEDDRYPKEELQYLIKYELRDSEGNVIELANAEEEAINKDFVFYCNLELQRVVNNEVVPLDVGRYYITAVFIVAQNGEEIELASNRLLEFVIAPDDVFDYIRSILNELYFRLELDKMLYLQEEDFVNLKFYTGQIGSIMNSSAYVSHKLEYEIKYHLEDENGNPIELDENNIRFENNNYEFVKKIDLRKKSDSNSTQAKTLDLGRYKLKIDVILRKKDNPDEFIKVESKDLVFEVISGNWIERFKPLMDKINYTVSVDSTHILQGDQTVLRAYPIGETFSTLSKLEKESQDAKEDLKFHYEMEYQLVDESGQEIRLKEVFPTESQGYKHFHKKLVLKQHSDYAENNIEDIKAGKYTIKADLKISTSKKDSNESDQDEKFLIVHLGELKIDVKPKDVIRRIKDNLHKIKYDIELANSTFTQGSFLEIKAFAIDEKNNILKKVFEDSRYQRESDVNYIIDYEVFNAKGEKVNIVKDNSSTINDNYKFMRDLVLIQEKNIFGQHLSVDLEPGVYKLKADLKVQKSSDFVSIASKELTFKVTQNNVSDSFVLMLDSRYLSFRDNSNKTINLCVVNLGNNKLKNLKVKLNEKQNNSDLAIDLKQKEIEEILPKDFKMIEIDLSTLEISKDARLEYEIQVSLNEKIKSSEKIYIDLIKSKPNLYLPAQVNTGGNENEESKGSFSLSNHGNAVLKNIKISCDDSNISFDKTQIEQIYVGGKIDVNFTLNKEVNKINEKKTNLRVKITADDMADAFIDINNITTTQQSGDFELIFLKYHEDKKDIGKNTRTFFRSLHMRNDEESEKGEEESNFLKMDVTKAVTRLKFISEVSEKNFEIDLKADKINANGTQKDIKFKAENSEIQVGNVLKGNYKVYVYNKDDKIIKMDEISAKPDMVAKKKILIDPFDEMFSDGLFNAAFQVITYTVNEVYEHKLILIGKEEINDIIFKDGKLEVNSAKIRLRPGETKTATLTMKNTGSSTINVKLEEGKELGGSDQYNSPNISIDSKLQEISSNSSIVLAPGASRSFTVRVSANSNAQKGEYHYKNFNFKYRSSDLFMMKQAGIGVYIQNNPGGQWGKGGDYVITPSYHNETNNDSAPEILYEYKKKEAKPAKFELTTIIKNARKIAIAKLNLNDIKVDIESVELQIRNHEGNLVNLNTRLYKNELGKAKSRMDSEFKWLLLNDVEEREEYKAKAVIKYKKAGSKSEIYETEEVSFKLPKPEPIEIIFNNVPELLIGGVDYDLKVDVLSKQDVDTKFVYQNLSLANILVKRIVENKDAEGKTSFIIQMCSPDETIFFHKIEDSLSFKLENLKDIDPEFPDDVKFAPLIKLKTIIKDKETIEKEERIKKTNETFDWNLIKDPVDIATGAQVIDKKILELDYAVPLEFNLFYNSINRNLSPLGQGFTNRYNSHISANDQKNQEKIIFYYDGINYSEFTKLSTSDLSENVDKEIIREFSGAEVDYYKTSDRDRRNDVLVKAPDKFSVFMGEFRYDLNKMGELIKISDGNSNELTITYQVEKNSDEKSYLVKRVSTKDLDKFIEIYYTPIEHAEGSDYISESLKYAFIEKVRDSLGREAKFVYDDFGRLIQIVDVMGRNISFTYDEKGRMLSERDNLGRLIFQNTYDDKDRVISQTDETKGVTRFAYDIYHSSSSDSNVNSNIVTNKLTNTLGDIIFYKIDTKLLEVLEIKDAKGIVLSSEFDIRGNLVARTHKNEKISYDYDSKDRLIRVKEGANKVEYAYEAGSLLSKPIEVKKNEDVLAKFSYNQDGKLNSVTDVFGENKSFGYEGNNLSSLNDNFGNSYNFKVDIKTGKITGVDAQGENLSYEYNDLGDIVKITSSTGSKTFEYNEDGSISAVIDELGNTTLYEYDEVGDLKRITDALGGEKEYSWDIYKNLLSYTDEAGRVTRYVYDSEDRLLKEIYPDRSEVNYSYDVRGNIIRIQDENGRSTRFIYDENDYLIEEISPSERKTKYHYDKRGNLITKTLPNGALYKYEYNEKDELIKSILPNNKEITYQYDSLGRILKVKTSGSTKEYIYDKKHLVKTATTYGNITQSVSFKYKEHLINQLLELKDDFHSLKYEYDTLGRIVGVSKDGLKTKVEYDKKSRVFRITDAHGNTKESIYDALDRVIKVIEKDKEGKLLRTSEISYDEVGNIKSLKDNRGNLFTLAYDSRNRLIEEKVQNSVEETKRVTRITRYLYDKDGRLTQKIMPNGIHMHYEYDEEGNLTKIGDSLFLIYSFAYDEMGQVTKRTDALSNTYSYEYNKVGQMTKAISPKGDETEYFYDEEGNLIKVKEALGNEMHYRYNERGDLLEIKAVQADYQESTSTNSTSNFESGLAQKSQETTILKRFEYDDKGLLISVIQPDIRETQYDYDETGKIIRKYEGDFTSDYYYDAFQRLIEIRSDDDFTIFEYDNESNLIHIKNKEGSIKRVYDNNRRILQEQTPTGKTIHYRYNSFGNLLSTTLEGKKTSYEYDDYGNLTQVEDFKGNITTYEYDGRNRIIEERRSNGILTTYEYDFNNNKTRILVQNKKGEILSDEKISYDELGRVKTKENKVLSKRYGEVQSKQSQALQSRYEGAKLISKNTKQIKYDKSGNITTIPYNNILVDGTYNSANKLIKLSESGQKELHFTYDAFGSRISKVSKGRYNNYAQLFELTREEYVQDHISDLSRVLEKTKEDAISGQKQSTYYVYGDGLISEIVEDGKVGANNENSQSNEIVINYHYDYQGNTIFATNEQGELISLYEYSPFGEERKQSGKDLDFTYSGKWGVQKEEYNLYYMRDRYYSSELHRFLSLDKDQGDLYRPSTLNPYAYVGNDPINFIDPSGMVAVNFGNAVKDFALASVGVVLGFGELALDGTIAAGSIIIGGISIGAILAADIATKVVAGGVVAANMIIGSIIAKSALVATNAVAIAKKTWTTGKEIVKKVHQAADNIRRVVDIFSKPKITDIFATEKEFTDYAINKVSEVRNSMPISELRTRGNVAVAYSDIRGLPSEFVAHSKISHLGDRGEELYNFSLLQEKQSFTTYMEVGHDRVVDTEAKILEDIYARIKDKNITGTIYLYTELSPCPSCKNIIGEFSQRLPNVTLKVFYGQGNLFFDGNDFLE